VGGVTLRRSGKDAIQLERKGKGDGVPMGVPHMMDVGGQAEVCMNQGVRCALKESTRG